MVVGTCKISLSLDGVFSLKDKRRIIKSIIERIKSRYNIAIAEVDMNDLWKVAKLGMACVSNQGSHADRTIEDVVRFIEKDGRVNLIEYKVEKIYL